MRELRLENTLKDVAEKLDTWAKILQDGGDPKRIANHMRMERVRISMVANGDLEKAVRKQGA